MASSLVRSADEGTSVSSVAAPPVSAVVCGISPAASPACGSGFPRFPRPAVPAVSAVALPPRPAGIHGVRPPRGGPHVIVPSLADRLVPAVAAAATFAPAVAAVLPAAAAAATFAPATAAVIPAAGGVPLLPLPDPSGAGACVVAACVAACAVAVLADAPP
ncbi:unnamed protein product [Closterium sp. Naga37s-1]|nr:unnamed protein product [Closterium sp. Naga37s-1]